MADLGQDGGRRLRKMRKKGRVKVEGRERKSKNERGREGGEQEENE